MLADAYGPVTDPGMPHFRLIAVLAIVLIVLAACLGSMREHAKKKELRRIREAMERQSPPK